MIKWITRGLLLAQLFVAAFIFYLLSTAGHLADAAAAALSLALVILFRALIVANNFLIASIYGEHESRIRLRWPSFLRLYCSEFAASMTTSSWTMAFRTFDIRLAPKPTGLPVLLIHGYGCNSGYWHSLSKLLLAHGISHRAVDLEPVFGSIDEYPPLIEHAIAQLQAETGQRQVVLVCHSMGGLAARAYLRTHGAAAVARVITLGTPHRGTGLANFGIGLNTRQMRWTAAHGTGMPSEWLAALHDKEEKAVRELFVSIYSTHDNIISPRSSCRMEGARNIEVGAIGHVALGMNPNVQQLVLDEIMRASASRQTGAPSTHPD
jgi:triacylglycerol lipase